MYCPRPAFQMEPRVGFLAGVLGALGARGGAEAAAKALTGDRAVEKFLNEAGCGRCADAARPSRHRCPRVTQMPAADRDAGAGRGHEHEQQCVDGGG